MVIPDSKYTVVREADLKVIEVQKQYMDGAITNGERSNKVIQMWSAVTEKVADEMFDNMKRADEEGAMNPIYIMADSGARGSKQQIRQLSGMRGLMAKPSGEVIETPITANFREGLTVLEYFISTHGARKGLADTALKTADSGYLTRRLVDVAQDVIVTEYDCGTMEGIYVGSIVESGEIIEELRDRIIGRVSLERIKDYDGNIVVDVNQGIDEDIASAIQAAGKEKVKIRSVLTCESRRGVCALCYGRNLGSGRMVELGETCGVIAAQSIGEPGTQLTMRTFHVGGTASRVQDKSRLDAKNNGIGALHQPELCGEQGRHAGGHEPLRLDRHSGRARPREGALPGGLRRAPQGQGRRARNPGPVAGRVGSVHLRHSDRDRRRGAVQGPAGRHHAERRSGRSDRPLAVGCGRLSG